MHVVGSAAGKGLSGPKATEALTGSKKRLKVFSVSLRAKREFTRMIGYSTGYSKGSEKLYILRHKKYDIL